MRARIGKALIIAGVALIAVSLGLGAYTLYNGMQAEKRADALLNQLLVGIPEPNGEVLPDYVLNPDMEMPEIDIDGDLCIGYLEIPAIEKKLPVISRWEYDQLKIAPTRYKGSAYKGDLIIAAHNYEAHFGRLSQLESGNKVIFTDAVGNVFQYKVVQMEILQPTDVEVMHSGEWDLTLFTCDSTITHRVTIRCERIK